MMKQLTRFQCDVIIFVAKLVNEVILKMFCNLLRVSATSALRPHFMLDYLYCGLFINFLGFPSHNSHFLENKIFRSRVS